MPITEPPCSAPKPQVATRPPGTAALPRDTADMTTAGFVGFRGPGERESQMLHRTSSVREARRAAPPWGMLAAIDLHGCERPALADAETIRTFVAAVIDAIGMRAHGPLHLERFGDGELEGWSAMQFIETSSITLHADEVAGRCFVDVFSCRPFDPDVAAGIAAGHFGGTATVTVLWR
jgi:S-adenosylmethionine/arginine decarboxylase-like enzyme